MCRIGRVEWLMSFERALMSKQIPALYAVRATAVFLVILFHFGLNVNGAFGVELFLVLSGFLITRILMYENDKRHRVSLKNFYRKRILRIIPAFYAYLIFGLLVHIVRHHEIPWRSIIASALFVQNYHDAIFHTGDTYVGHSWYLSIQMQFYLLWPLVFSVFRKNLSQLIKLLVITILGVWIYRAILWFGIGVYQGYIYHAFEARVDHVLVGCLLAVLIKMDTIANLAYKVSWHPSFPLITIAILGISASFHSHFDYRYSVGYAFEPILIAVLIVQLVGVSCCPVWRTLTENPVVKYLGQISYSLYLYQQLILFTARRITQSLPIVIQLIFAIVVTIIAASASYFLVERQFAKIRVQKHKSVVPRF